MCSPKGAIPLLARMKKYHFNLPGDDESTLETYSLFAKLSVGVDDGKAKVAIAEKHYSLLSFKKGPDGDSMFKGMSDCLRQCCDDIKYRAYPGWQWGPYLAEVKTRSDRGGDELPSESVRF